MGLDYVKKFLRVDFDDDDTIITLEVEASKEYIKNAVGKYSEENPLMRLLLLAIVADMYENRSTTIAGNSKNNYIIRSIVNQLQCSEWSDNDECQS